MQVQKKRKPYDDINITPMVDLTFVLLVIFILMTTAAIEGIKINLPKASSSQSMAEPTTKAISVDGRGQIYLDTFPVTPKQLEQELRIQKAITPDLPVVIRGDQISQYGKIMEALDAVSRAGITQIGLVSERQRGS